VTLKRLCTPIIAIVALSFGLIGCGGSQQQLTQPTNSEIASGYSASAWRNVDSKAFTKAQKVSSLKFHVVFDRFSDSKFVGNDFYYEVKMITHGEFSRSRHKIPSDAMGAISRDLATRAALSIVNRQKTNAVTEIAQIVSKLSICMDGTPKLNDRILRKPNKLTPQQQARITAATGGNGVLILGKSPAQLRRMGLGFLVDRPKGARRPNIEYTRRSDPRFDSVTIQMKCDR